MFFQTYSIGIIIHRLASRWANGIVVKYMIEISLDGIRWEEAARGEFANIQNNPVEQHAVASSGRRLN